MPFTLRRRRAPAPSLPRTVENAGFVPTPEPALSGMQTPPPSPVSRPTTPSSAMSFNYGDDDSLPRSQRSYGRPTPPPSPPSTMPTTPSRSISSPPISQPVSPYEIGYIPPRTVSLTDDPKIEAAAKVWNTATPVRLGREKIYLSWLYSNVEQYGYPFLEKLIIAITKCSFNCNIKQPTPNIVLARLLVLYNRAGILCHKAKEKEATDEEGDWERFQFHPACIFAHGKRVIVQGSQIKEIFAWLKRGFRTKKRFSSHDLTFPQTKTQNYKETKSLRNAMSGRSDVGLDLALFGLESQYPFQCAVTHNRGKTFTYQPNVVKPGKFGHLCFSPVDLHHGEQIGFIGLENTSPGHRSPHGYPHGIKCVENFISAFWMPKWDDKALIKAINTHATKQGKPHLSYNNLDIPGTGYGKIKVPVNHRLAQEILSLNDHQVLIEAIKIVSNPEAGSSPHRPIKPRTASSPGRPGKKPPSAIKASLHWMNQAGAFADSHSDRGFD